MKPEGFFISLTAVFCLFSLTIHAQQVQVKDMKTQESLPYVTIISSSGNNVSHTNTRGVANVSGFKGDTLIFRIIGYRDTVIPYSTLSEGMNELGMQQDNIALNEFVVSAHKWEQEKEDIPAVIKNIDSREVDFKNPQTTADLIGATDYVYVQKSQLGGGSPMIRGFATNRIVLVVDGIRMNNAIFRSGNLQNVISLDAQSIQSAEVLFGPSSVIYGSDAIGGVLDFHTLSPELSGTDESKVNGNAMLRSSSANNEKSFHFDLNAGGEKWASLTSLSFSDFEDQRMGSIGPDDYLREYYQVRSEDKDTIIKNDDPELQTPSGYSQMNGMQKLLFNPNEQWEFTYALHFSRTSSVPRYDRLIQAGSHSRFRYAEWRYGPQEWMMNHLEVLYRPDSNMFFNHMRITASMQNYEESRHDRKFGHAIFRHRIENVDAYSLNFDFEKQMSERTSLFYGGEGVLNRVFSTAEEENILTETTSAAPTRYPDGSSWQSYGAYLLLRHEVKDWLTLNAGGRYTYFQIDAAFDTAFYDFPFREAHIGNGAATGSFGFTVHPSKKWRLFANASTGFRAPNIDDVGKVFDSEPGSVVVPNPDLEAEYAYNGEVGFAARVLRYIKIDGAAFYTFLENAMTRRPFSFDGKDSIVYDGTMSEVQALQNVNSAYVYGFQAGFYIELTKGLSIESSFSYQTGRERDDSVPEEYPVRHAAPWFGTSAVTWSGKKLKLQAYAVYNGKFSYEDLALSERGKPHLYASDDQGRPYSPSWYTLNFKASYQLEEGVSLTAGVDNITDIRYRPYSSGISGPGRNFMAAMHVSF